MENMTSEKVAVGRIDEGVHTGKMQDRDSHGRTTAAYSMDFVHDRNDALAVIQNIIGQNLREFAFRKRQAFDSRHERHRDSPLGTRRGIFLKPHPILSWRRWMSTSISDKSARTLGKALFILSTRKKHPCPAG
jgi:hypothetical protein